MSRRKSYFNVEPRYTPGSPAAIWDEDLAERVAEQERDGYEQAMSGVWGEEQRQRADVLGLDLIVFSMAEKPKGWEIYDLITGITCWWPFQADCPTCGAKRVRCRRGNLEEHRIRGSAYTCRDQSFVGRCGSAATER